MNQKTMTELIKNEMRCHIPHGIIAIALSIIIVSFITFFAHGSPEFMKQSGLLFHSLHFTHILFASSSIVLMFRRYSSSFFGAVALGLLVPAVFCTLSDVLLPYWGGQILGLNVTLHLCFKSHLGSILPFLGAGIVNGMLLDGSNSNSLASHSIMSHFAHAFISALASFLYLISHGLTDWWHVIGQIFVLLLIAVVIPCTVSDVIVPIFCASRFNEDPSCTHDCPKGD